LAGVKQLKSEKKGFKQYQNFIVAIMFVVYGLVFLDRLSIVFLFPFIAPELGLNNTQIGLAVGITGFAFGISTLIFASISDFLGRKKAMLIILIFVFSITTFLSGIVESFASLLLVRLLMGIAEGPVVPLVQSIVMAESSANRRGLNMGVVQSASALIGVTLAPVLMVGLAVAFDWRSAFYIIAVPGIVSALILWKYLREPKFVRQSKEEDKAAKPTKAEYKRIFKTRNIWMGMIIGVCNIMFIFTLTAFLPTFLAQMTSYGETRVGMMLGLMGLMMFIGQLLAPTISDRFGRLPIIKIFSLAAIFLPVLIALYYNNFIVLLISLLIFSLGNGYQPLVMVVMPAESVPKAFSASAIAAIILVAEVFGGSLGPVMAGILSDQFGLVSALWVAAGAAFVAFLCTFAMKETAPVKMGFTNEVISTTTVTSDGAKLS
jgi:MFS transporter, ACS family, hexuronate transporter